MSDNDWRPLAKELAETGDVETAERLLAVLKREDPKGGGPILRVRRFCDAMRTWAKAFSTPLPQDHEDQQKERDSFYEHWRRVELAITKSNLLYRLIYLGEQLRTRPCPTHKGRWSGCNANEPACICQCGINITGWLPNDDDEVAKSHVPPGAVLHQPPGA